MTHESPLNRLARMLIDRIEALERAVAELNPGGAIASTVHAEPDEADVERVAKAISGAGVYVEDQARAAILAMRENGRSA